MRESFIGRSRWCEARSGFLAFSACVEEVEVAEGPELLSNPRGDELDRVAFFSTLQILIR